MCVGGGWGGWGDHGGGGGSSPGAGTGGGVNGSPLRTLHPAPTHPPATSDTLSPFPQSCHPGWWYNPDFIINDLNIQSAIGYPAHDEAVPLAHAGGAYPVRGYAFCGE